MIVLLNGRFFTTYCYEFSTLLVRRNVVYNRGRRHAMQYGIVWKGS